MVASLIGPLRSLRRLVQQNWRRLKTELQAYAALRGRTDIRLASFLSEQAIERCRQLFLELTEAEPIVLEPLEA